MANLFYVGVNPKITIESLKNNGFEVDVKNMETPYSVSLKYEDDEAIVDFDPKSGQLSAIIQGRGDGFLNVVKKLYETYDIKLLDEGSMEFAEIIHWNGSDEELDSYIAKANEKLKTEIMASNE